MDRPFISEGLASFIADMKERAFDTKAVLQGTHLLILYRDSDEDGTEYQVPGQEVIIRFAAREPTQQRANATEYMGADGELLKKGPFDVQEGDRFRLPNRDSGSRGPVGVVTIVMPPRGGITRALFTLRV